MSIRVTAAEVKDIMDECSIDDSIVTVYITAASAVIDSAFSGDTTTSTTLLKEIERWYSAHLVASTLDRTTQEEKIGDAAILYSAKMGKGLESTPYGQAVLQLDVSGKMAKLGKRAASIYAIPNFED